MPLPIFSPLYNSLIDLTDIFQICNHKYTFSITSMLIIIISLLVYNYYNLYYIQDFVQLKLSLKI